MSLTASRLLETVAAICALVVAMLYVPDLPLAITGVLNGNTSDLLRTPDFFIFPLVLVAILLLTRWKRALTEVATVATFLFLIGFMIIRDLEFSWGSFPLLHLVYPLGLLTVVLSAIGIACAGLSTDLQRRTSAKLARK